MDDADRSARRGVLVTVLVAAAAVAVVLAGVMLTAGGRASREEPAAGDAAAQLGSAGLEAGELGEGGRAGDPQPLPEATLAGFDGGPAITLSDYRGQPLVVNFWATWCAPCVAEMPDLQAVADQVRGQVAFLGVNYMDAPSNATTFVRDLGISYDLATDADGSYLERRLEGFGMPTTLLVDADGTIVYRHTGPLTADELRQLLYDRLDVPVEGASPASSPPDAAPTPTAAPPDAPVGAA